ncbi:MAG: sensor histidine kinase [Chitinophagaceae bacterium]
MSSFWENRNIKYHVFGILLFCSLPFISSYFSLYKDHVLSYEFTLREFAGTVLMIVFFYMNYFTMMPKYYFERKHVTFGLWVIGAFIMINVIPLVLWPKSAFTEIDMTTEDFDTYSSKPYLSEIKRNLFRFLGVFFASQTMSLNARYKKSNEERMNAELASLKAQINPHFLFNTLNSIYSLSLIKSDKTPTAIVKLSSLMRYVITETNKRFVALDREIQYVNSYIELQRIRLDNTAEVNYSCEGDTEDKVIAPLILLPFIENAFKHGVNPETPSQIDIQIAISEHHIYMNVFNLKVPHIINHDLRTGYGQENIKRQLELIYANKHELQIEDKEQSFSVTLKINLT